MAGVPNVSDGVARLQWRDHLAGTAAVILCAPPLGIDLMWLGSLIPRREVVWLPYSPWTDPAWVIEATGWMLTFSLLAGLTGSVLAIPLSRLAARFGWGGWGTAMLVAGVPSAAVAPAFDAPPGVAAPCAVLGLLYWLGVRLSRPAAFATAQGRGLPHLRLFGQ